MFGDLLSKTVVLSIKFNKSVVMPEAPFVMSMRAVTAYNPAILTEFPCLTWRN